MIGETFGYYRVIERIGGGGIFNYTYFAEMLTSIAFSEVADYDPSATE